MSSRMGEIGGSHLRGQQNSDFGRLEHKCLWSCNFANNKGNIVIFRVRTEEIRKLSSPILFMGLSDSDIHVKFYF